MVKQKTNPKDTAMGCGVLFALVFIIGSCTAIFSDDDDGAPPPAQAAASPTTSTTQAPTIDAAARTMCKHSVLATAHRKAGNTTEAENADMDANDALSSSKVVALEVIGDHDYSVVPREIRAWCKKNDPRKAPKVRKTRQATDPLPGAEDEPGTGGGETVTPGAYCSTGGATGISKRGRPYTCKGPGRLRWRS